LHFYRRFSFVQALLFLLLAKGAMQIIIIICKQKVNWTNALIIYLIGDENAFSNNFCFLSIRTALALLSPFFIRSSITFSSFGERGFGKLCIENEILMHFRTGKKQSNDIYLGDALDVDKDGNPLTVEDTELKQNIAMLEALEEENKTLKEQLKNK